MSSRFGKAFPDQMRRVSGRYGRFKKIEDQSWDESLIALGFTGETSQLSAWRRFSFAVLSLIVFSVLFGRLFHLQIREGELNRELADSNRIQVKVIHAPRGVVYDRNGKILAQNEPAFRLVDPGNSAARPRLVTRDEALRMETGGDPNFKNLEIDTIRSYPYGVEMAHVLGYLGEITDDELKSPDYAGYKLGDKVGRGGIEQSYEKVLRGIDGGEVVEVDSSGRQIRTLTRTDPIPGQDLYLSIDADIQVRAYAALEKAAKGSKSCCGAVVLQDPRNGEILALASYPSFDTKNLQGAFKDPDSPLLDRVIAGTYPPGSTFKIASSLAGLDSGKITRSTVFEDTGVMRLGPYSFANWYFGQYGKTEGQVDIVKALKRSNDIYFYQLGRLTGEQTLADEAKRLGLGARLGIDLPGEAAGLVPDGDWKMRNTGQPWYPGDTLHMVIGQGYVLATPLQINNLTSFVAADGRYYPPHLALKITGPDGNLIKQFRFDPTNSYQFKPADIQLVKEGLSKVPLPGGTAWPFFTFPIPTAGKTGTAEFGDKNKTHAWYTAYGPARNPVISATVLIEGGGEGSTVASPVVKELFRWYLSPDKSNLLKDVTPTQATDSARRLGE